MQRLLFLALAATILLPSTGCNLEPAKTAWLWVDNTHHTPITVTVDGVPKGNIEPGKYKRIPVDLGSRQIEFASDDEIFRATNYTFEPSEIPVLPASYLIGPSDDVCYCYTSVTYGYDEQPKQLEKIITRVAHKDNDRPNPELVSKFERLLGEMEVFEATEPTRFSVQLHMLQPMPNSVQTMSRHASSRSRNTIIRIPRELHDLIVGLNEIDVPSENDMKAAAELRLVIDALVPFED